MTFAWIEERRAEYPLALLCRVLGVSRSGDSARRPRPPGDTARRRDRLVQQIRAIHTQVKERYGRPRMTAELTARGVPCCVSTVAKVMRATGIRARGERRFVRTTDSRHRLPVSENVSDRNFVASKPNHE